MKRLRHILTAIMIAATTCPAVVASPAVAWEEVTVPASAVTHSMEMEGETEIAVADGYIYIWCERTVTVKLFSILGQLLSQETVKPGLHRLKLNSRGIYILRAGSLTRRITL